MVASMGFVEKSLTEPKSQKLHIVKPQNPELAKFLTESKDVNIVYVDSLAQGKKMVEGGKASAVVEFETNIVADNLPPQTIMRVVFDKDQIKSQAIVGGLEEAARRQNDANVTEIFKDLGLAAEAKEAVKVEKMPIEKPKGSAGSTLAGMLPYLIVIWAFYGAFSIAGDIVAGEKERQTLETLLIAPVKRRQVAIGKFLALASVSFVSSISSLVTMLLLGTRSDSQMMFGEGGFAVSAGTFLSMLAVIIPLVAMFAGILLAISAFARNIRECQTYLTLVSFIVLMPAVFSQFIGFTDLGRSAWVNFVPILNSATVLRNALLGRLDPSALGITVGVSILLAIVSIGAAIKLFEREQVLVRI
jgi:sodium transport system permease protein